MVAFRCICSFAEIIPTAYCTVDAGYYRSISCEMVSGVTAAFSPNRLLSDCIYKLNTGFWLSLSREI